MCSKKDVPLLPFSYVLGAKWGQKLGQKLGKLGGKLGTEMYPGQDGQLPLPVALPLLRRALLYSSQCAHFIAD
jgi:hypothetical protein